jgi:hypothetical protein
MDLYYKPIVWVIFWRKLQKKKQFFCVSEWIYTTVWVIFWRKLQFFSFCVSEWSYIKGYNMGLLLETINFFLRFPYQLIL